MKIEKEKKTVIAYTYNYKIKCDVFTPPGSRLSDFIGSLGQKQFIPVSNAIVSDIFGNPVCKAKFLELNVNEILFLIPDDDLLTERKV
ncbi:MAG: hypothetical protein Q8R48_03130 [Candidatus Omnitrophota bacterium]|nr:hypothetical protein [Candidatus Omnitrophota bacterium]